MAIILVWSIIRHHSWYIKRIAPILPFIGKYLCKLCKICSHCHKRPNPREFDSIVTFSTRQRPGQSEESENGREESIPMVQIADTPIFLPTITKNNSTQPDTSELGRWDVKISVYGNWQLETTILEPDSVYSTYVYNPLNSTVVDILGTETRKVSGPPTSKVLMLESIFVIYKLTPTTTKMGKIIHRDYPFIFYSIEEKNWINSTNSSVIPGLPPPKTGKQPL